MLEVRDGNRTLTFEGQLLSRSSSQRPGRYRWVEFALYRTESGKYVLERKGISNVFHVIDCDVARHNDLQPTSQQIPRDSYPCELCEPTYELDVSCQEKPRYWAQVSDSASAVVDALYRVDESGTHFLTAVARRLLERGAELDRGVREAYSVERVL